MPSPVPRDRRNRRSASVHSYDSRAVSPYCDSEHSSTSRSRSRSSSRSRRSERNASPPEGGAERRHLGHHVADQGDVDGDHNVQEVQQAAVGQAEGKIPYEKASLLRKIVDRGMPKQESKALRELFPYPSFEGSFVLQCPAIEDVFARRLKKVRGKKQDFWEKSWLSAQYKAVDVARPLLELWRRVDKNDPNYRFIDSAVRLWGVAFNDMTKQRRYNVIHQTDSEYLSMLSDSKVFSEREVQHLFGDRFIKALSE